MTSEISMNHLHIFYATVLTVLISLPCGLVLFLASKLSKNANPPHSAAPGSLDLEAFESNELRREPVVSTA